MSIESNNLRNYISDFYFSYLKSPRVFKFSGDKLELIKLGETPYVYGDGHIEFYKEDGKIVFDFYYDVSGLGIILYKEGSHLIYSSSSKYGVLHYEDGMNIDKYIDITYTIAPYTENLTSDLLEGYIKIKEEGIDGTIIFSDLSSDVEYCILDTNGNVKTINNFFGMSYAKEVPINTLMEKIEGINHNDTTTVEIRSFYILYKK